MSHSYPSGINREQFARILPTLESARRRTKPRTVDLYDVFCGVLYLLKSGCQWRMLPADFPNWHTCYKYFRQWSERHIAVDTQGLPHAIHVTTANVTDRAGALAMFDQHRDGLSQVQKVLVDGGYTGKPFAAGVQSLLGASVEVVKRNEMHTFVVLPKRWVVERSFAWLEKCLRLWKNCEGKLNTSLQMVVLAFAALILKRS